MQLPNNILDYLRLTDAQKMDSRINATYITDFGIVKSVQNNKTVTVQSTTRTKAFNGDVFPAAITNEVELLFPMMGGLSIEGEVKVGDLVLLIGLRNIVPTTVGVTEPIIPADNFHYGQATLKAIPLAGINTASVIMSAIGGVYSLSASEIKLNSNTGKVQLKNNAGSLYSLTNTLNSDLITFATTTSTATTAPQIAVAAATLLAALNTLTTSIAALLEP